MNFDEKKDLYLRNTHSARINRIKNIFADERKANTVSHNRISKVINNSDNELTPSHNNRNNNTYSENNIWLTPNKDINNTNNKLKSKNLIFNEDNQKNEYRNDLLYKSELDDEGYIDNENDIFNFSRLNVIAIFFNLFIKLYIVKFFINFFNYLYININIYEYKKI